MTFEQLSYFLEVYQQQSVTKAAETLFVSRQVVSHVIKKLEAEFNVELFVRNNNTLLPTGAAHLLYRHTLYVLRARTQLVEAMNNLHQNPAEQQECTIALSQVPFYYYEADLLSLLSQRFSETTFHLVDLHLVNIPEEYKIVDIAVLLIETDKITRMWQELPDGHSLKAVSEHQMYAWLSRFSPYSSADTLTDNDLSQLKCITLKPKSFNDLFRYKSFAANHFFTSSSLATFLNYMKRPEYFTYDIMLKGHTLHADTFKNMPVVLKPIRASSCSLVLVYKDTAVRYIPGLTKILANPDRPCWKS